MWWQLLDGGSSMAGGATAARRLVARCGLWSARRRRGFSAPDDVTIHPDARIDPRGATITLGPRCTVAPGGIIQGQVSLGADCSVQSYAVLVGYGSEGRIELGDGVRIAPHAMMIAANHRFEAGRPIHTQGLEPAPIVVEDDVWIAGRVVVTAGVRIGTGSVVAAGAVVTRDVPSGSVVGGVPARLIRER